jgi:hypothetical protein
VPRRVSLGIGVASAVVGAVRIAQAGATGATLAAFVTLLPVLGLRRVAAWAQATG